MVAQSQRLGYHDEHDLADHRRSSEWQTLAWRRYVRIRRPRWDRWILVQALLKIAYHSRNRHLHPAIVGHHVRFFFRIRKKIEQIRNGQLCGRLGHIVQPDQMILPIAPLDGIKVTIDEYQESFTARLRLSASEKVRLVNSIYWAIFRNLCSTELRKRREHVN